MTTPLCSYFGTCGGCSLQHVDYSPQLLQKRCVVEHATGLSDVLVFSGASYGYRNRMDFVFHPTGVGFRKKGSWDTVIDIDSCVISDTRLNQLLKEVRTFFYCIDAFHLRKHTGTFRYVVIRTPRLSSSLSFVLSSDSMHLSEAIEQIRAFSLTTSADTVVITYVASQTDVSVSDDFFLVKGDGFLREHFLGKEFVFPVQGFFQNNSYLAEEMQRYCRTLFSSHSTFDAHLLDLYGGVGTFGLCLADLFSALTLVENVPAAVLCAEKNALLCGVTSFTAHCLDAKYLSRLRFSSSLYVLCDPPRSGMHQKTITALRALRPLVIVYISCNLEQLARDLAQFPEYTVKSAALFDLFPQTKHCEAVVELVITESF